MIPVPAKVAENANPTPRHGVVGPMTLVGEDVRQVILLSPRTSPRTAQQVNIDVGDAFVVVPLKNNTRLMVMSISSKSLVAPCEFL